MSECVDLLEKPKTCTISVDFLFNFQMPGEVLYLDLKKISTVSDKLKNQLMAILKVEATVH